NHAFHQLSTDPTIGTCWDADRLDLGRYGIYPKAQFLSTEAAKDPDLIARAYQKSVAGIAHAS
ncbi:MAG: hypothetical protein WBM99_15485, partial [Psychromonas sp.]